MIIAGGSSLSGARIASTEVYNIAANTWSEETPLPSAKNFLAGGSLSRGSYVSGGSSGQIKDSINFWNPDGKEWKQEGGMKAQRYRHAMAAVMYTVVKNFCIL